MTIAMPSMGNSLFITDPQIIIATVWRRYCRTPANTVPILGDLIISLPQQRANCGREPAVLVTNMQSDLQGVFDRIFNGTRPVVVSVTQKPITVDSVVITTTITYGLLNGELDQVSTKIYLNSKGELVTPQDTLPPYTPSL